MSKGHFAELIHLPGKVWRSGRRSGFRYAVGRVLEEGGNILCGLAASKPGGRLPQLKKTMGPTVIILAGLHWNFRFQRPQQLANALVRIGCRVYYVVPGTAAAKVPGWRLLSGKTQHPVRLCLYSEKYGTFSTLWQNVRLAQSLAASLGHLCACLKDQSSEAYIIVQHPMWARVLEGLEKEQIFYDCLDDFGDFDDAPSDIRQAEDLLTCLCTGIISTALPLHQRWAHINKPRALIRNGCDYTHFANAHPLPIPHSGKIIGYHGAIAEWFDTDIIHTLARAFPQHHFLLVGGDTTGASAILKGIPNIRLIGEVPYVRLPAYVATFDVGLVPFKIRALTQGTNPVKVYEYLAAGKPVIASPLPEMAVFGDLVTQAREDEWVYAVAKALDNPPAPSAAQAYAACQTWDHRAEEFLEFIRQCAKATCNQN